MQPDPANMGHGRVYSRGSNWRDLSQSNTQIVQLEPVWPLKDADGTWPPRPQLT